MGRHLYSISEILPGSWRFPHLKSDRSFALQSTRPRTLVQNSPPDLRTPQPCRPQGLTRRPLAVGSVSLDQSGKAAYNVPEGRLFGPRPRCKLLLGTQHACTTPFARCSHLSKCAFTQTRSLSLSPFALSLLPLQIGAGGALTSNCERSWTVTAALQLRE